MLFPNRICLLALLALLTSGAAALAAPARKHALLIGISNYSKLPHTVPNDFEPGPLFPDIQCNEDLICIRAALVDTFKFDPDPETGEIVTLNMPEQTTRQGILDAFDRLADRTQAGDLVYIHYSGHGSQVPDATKPDGLETAIVPSDYKDDQSNVITGKELGAELTKIKAKHPAQIVFSLDCCHSGTPTRGSGQIRGLNDRQYASWYARWHRGALPPTEPASRRRLRGSPETVMPELEGAGYVILSACANDQSAQETTDDRGRPLGRFSYVLAQTLIQASPATTYQQIYDQIWARFRQKFPDQTPQVDGDPNTLLLDGTAKEIPSSIRVTVAAPGRYLLDAGSLQGMSKGSEFAVYDPAATDFNAANELAVAKITTVNVTTATLEINERLKPDVSDDRFIGAHAVERLHNYATPPLTLDGASVQKAVPAQAAEILAKLKHLNIIATTPDADSRFDTALVRDNDPEHGAELNLIRVGTRDFLAHLDESADLFDQLYAALQREARYRYASSLGASQSGLNHNYHVALRIVPVAVKADANGHSVKDAEGHVVYDHDNPSETTSTLHVDDYFVIEVQNRSPVPLFLTVLDLDSDGNIGQAWPSAASTAQDNIVLPTRPGQWARLWRASDKDQQDLYHATAADPQEMYEAIATDEYVNFKDLRTRDAECTPIGPFSGLLGLDTNRGTLAIGRTDSGDPSAWTAAPYHFQVLPNRSTEPSGRGK